MNLTRYDKSWKKASLCLKKDGKSKTVSHPMFFKLRQISVSRLVRRFLQSAQRLEELHA